MDGEGRGDVVLVGYVSHFMSHSLFHGIDPVRGRADEAGGKGGVVKSGESLLITMSRSPTATYSGPSRNAG